MQVTVIGLGSIGMGIAASLLRDGHAVVGVDIVPERREELEEMGGRFEAGVRQACCRAEVVISVVVDARQTEAVVFGEDGAAHSMRPDTVLVSCATLPPERTRDLARRLEVTGRHFLDAPTSGGPAKARSGEMTLMASGSSTAFAKAGPVLKSMASKVCRLGDEPGVGSAMKLINQRSSRISGSRIALSRESLQLRCYPMPAKSRSTMSASSRRAAQKA